MVTLTHDDVVHEFTHLINLDADDLEAWLHSPESQSVGHRPGERDETVIHRTGRRIVDLLRRDQFDDTDVGHMREVVDLVNDQLAQRPHGDVRDTAWRFSLMNCGHDPLRAS